MRHHPLMACLLVLALPALAGCLSDESSNQSQGRLPPAPWLSTQLPEVSASQTLDELFTFSKDYSERAANLPDHVGAREWLATQFADAGLEVWVQDFETGIPQQNIAGIKWGENRHSWVIVGAHYDMTTTGGIARAYSEGAYDDGSGTLMTVQLAKAWANLATYHTLVFVAFDGEERGLEGSGAFAQAIVDGNHPYNQDGIVTMRAMLDLDMIGLNWPGIEAPIYFDTNSQAMKDTVEEARKAMGMPDGMIKYQGISLGRSDYAHFMDLNIPTGFFISDFEEWQLPAGIPVVVDQGAYPFWHLEDTYETMLLMAGSEESLEAGFQTALDLSNAIVGLTAIQPHTDIQ